MLAEKGFIENLDDDEIPLIAAIIEREMNGWLPIEQAPKDQDFLASGLDGGKGPSRHTVIARHLNCPQFGPHFTDCATGSKMLDYLTHVRPLPQPPEI